MTLKILINLPKTKFQCCPVCGTLQADIPLVRVVAGGKYEWICGSCGCHIGISIFPPICKYEGVETVVVDE